MSKKSVIPKAPKLTTTKNVAVTDKEKKTTIISQTSLLILFIIYKPGIFKPLIGQTVIEPITFMYVCAYNPGVARDEARQAILLHI